MKEQTKTFLRYPGGKQRYLQNFVGSLPSGHEIQGRYFEPFVGGGTVFFWSEPKQAVLSDINIELITLYDGIRCHPMEVWEIFRNLPGTKKAYYQIRSWNIERLDLVTRAARTLYLNRTCFKGMWRHNANGQFNVGYGGQDRRWVISQKNLFKVSERLKSAILRCSDFEEIIEETKDGDFIFLDPPYRPGECEMLHEHYRFGRFSFADQGRLANALKRASGRGVVWAMTNSSHPNIVSFYSNNIITPLLRGTGRKIGQITNDSGEVLIRNYEEVTK